MGTQVIQPSKSGGVEAHRLQELEAVIERGMQTFVEVGNALKEISDSKLYRWSGFQTFEVYCQERWRWGRQAGWYYIRAAEVVENVKSTLQNSQPSLTQAAELASLAPEQQKEVAQSVDFSSTPVREIKEIVKEVKSGTPVQEAIASKMAVHYSSDSEEWYTPPEVIERADRVLGGINLDPCSNAAKNIPAKHHFTAEDNGLQYDWFGSVYMNPPYGRAIVEWVEKLVSEKECGNVESAIALVPARVDTDWFRLFRDYAVCFIDGRLKFSGHQNSAPFPSAVVYLGNDIDAFDAAFSDMGDVWVRWKR